jgi:hypothetical protein
VISKSHRLAFCQVPKAANELFLMYMRRLGGAPDWADPRKTFFRNRKRNHKSGYIYYADILPHEEADAILVDPGYYKFAFVRHPLSRFFSAYQNKIVEESNGWWRRLYRVHRNATMEEFATAFLKVPPHRQEVHFQPQHLICRPDVISYDHMGKLEELDAGWTALQARLGRSDKVQSRSQATTVNQATHGDEAWRQYLEKHPRSPLVQRLVQYFQVDLELFKYEVAPPRRSEARRVDSSVERMNGPVT